MFLTHIRTLVYESLREVFDAEYPVEQFRNIHISREYPLRRDHYPAIWTDFDPQGSVRNMGIGHVEWLQGDSQFGSFYRWAYRGTTTFTVVSLSSLERDRMVDELIKVLAHGRESPQRKEFRSMIEDNTYIATQMNWDDIQMRGAAVSPGTPWGTDDMVYEWTLALETQGEFLSDGNISTVIPISEVRITEYTAGQDPAPDDDEGWV